MYFIFSERNVLCVLSMWTFSRGYNNKSITQMFIELLWMLAKKICEEFCVCFANAIFEAQ